MSDDGYDLTIGARILAKRFIRDEIETPEEVDETNEEACGTSGVKD